MGEEAYDETLLDGVEGYKEKLVVRGGYCREEVYVGICAPGDDEPTMLVAVDGAALKRALREMQIGERTNGDRRGPHRDLDVEIASDRFRGCCECGWRGQWKLSERAAQTSASMHQSHAKRRRK